MPYAVAAGVVVVAFVVTGLAGVGAAGTGVSNAVQTGSCSASETTVAPGESVTLDASASTEATAYRYDRVGDGNFGQWLDRSALDVTYDEAGTYEPQAQVRSPDDSTDTAACGTVTVESDNEPPVAEFTYSPSAPTAEEAVTFESVSSDPDGEIIEHEWSVEGDPIGQGPTLDYTFPGPGEYTVELFVTDDYGASDAYSETVSIQSGNEPPTVEFSYSPVEPAHEETVTFDAAASDADGDIVAHEWTIDGEPVGEGPSLSYAFPGPGEYTVGVTVTDDDGATTTAERTVTLQSGNEPPTVEFSYSPVEPAPEETVAFDASASDTDGDIVAYEWTIDGEPVGEGPSLSYAFPGPGEYTVTITVTDDDGATTTVERTVTVQSGNEPPAVEFSYSPVEPAPDETVTFDASASDADGDIVAHEWTIDGELVGEGPSLSYAFPGPGEYTVSVTVTDDDGATTTADRMVTVPSDNEPPSSDVEPFAGWGHTPLEPTAGQTVTLFATGPADTGLTYQWDLDGDGEVDRDGRLVAHAFTETGETTVTLTVVNANGDRDSDTQTITVRTARESDDGDAEDALSIWMSPLDPRPGQRVTLVASANLPADQIERYRWDLDGDGEIDADGRSHSTSFPAGDATGITLEVVGTDGDVTTESSQVSTSGEPSIEPDTGPSVWVTPLDPQPRQRVTFVAAPVIGTDEVEEYQWDFDGDGEVDAEGRTVSTSFPENGVFSINVTIERTNGSTANAESRVGIGNASIEVTTTDGGNETEENDTASGESNRTTTESADDSGPGLGVAAALAALLALVAVLARRGER